MQSILELTVVQLAAGKQVQMEGGSAARAGMAAAVAAKVIEECFRMRASSLICVRQSY